MCEGGGIQWEDAKVLPIQGDAVPTDEGIYIKINKCVTRAARSVFSLLSERWRIYRRLFQILPGFILKINSGRA